MSFMRTNTPLKVFLVVSILILFTTQVSPAIYVNGGGKIFGDRDFVEIGFSENGVVSLEFYVVKGAGYFLKSCSDFLYFLNKAELAEIEGADYDGLKLHLNNAIANMELARNIYLEFREKAAAVPYNASIIDQLLSFNYTQFQKEKGLLKPVFSEVKAYLENGEVREFFEAILCHTEEILNDAYILKATVDLNQFPEIPFLWDIQHKFSKSMLMGQYAARVFLEIQ